MNKQSKIKWWQVVLSIIVMGVLCIAIRYILVSLWKVFSGLQKETAAALIAASATILVSVFSVVGAKYYERKRVIEEELRQRKIPIYEEFIKFLFKIIGNEKLESESLNEKDMEKFFIEFTQKLMIWGSDEVIEQWSKYRKVSIEHFENGDSNLNDMFQLENILLAIRKDTGHKNKNLKKGDLLGLFVNDIEKYIT